MLRTGCISVRERKVSWYWSKPAGQATLFGFNSVGKAVTSNPWSDQFNLWETYPIISVLHAKQRGSEQAYEKSPRWRRDIKTVPCAWSFNYPWPHEPFSQSRSESQKEGKGTPRKVSVFRVDSTGSILCIKFLSDAAKAFCGKALLINHWLGLARMKAGLGKTYI